jgi:hypothetical protein
MNFLVIILSRFGVFCVTYRRVFDWIIGFNDPYDIKISNRCFENVAQFRYLGRTKQIKTDSEGN